MIPTVSLEDSLLVCKRCRKSFPRDELVWVRKTNTDLFAGSPCCRVEEFDTKPY